MGCPDTNIIKKGAGAALMKNLKLTKEFTHDFDLKSMRKHQFRFIPTS